MKKQRKHYTPEEKVAMTASDDGILPLAEGVLRERNGCLSAERAGQPLRRGAHEKPTYRSRSSVRTPLAIQRVAVLVQRARPIATVTGTRKQGRKLQLASKGYEGGPQ